MSDSAILFDLDGTLIDSLEDIAESANRALAREGFPTHPIADYKHFVGEGVVVLLQRILPPDHRDDATIERVAAVYRESYATGWNLKTRLYDGVPELLDELAARAIPLAVLSNKPDEFTKLCVKQYLARWPFRQVIGQRSDLPRKPDPGGALLIARELGVDPRRCLFVGDTATDMRTARGAGMHAVGVHWGFRAVPELLEAGADAIIDHPRDLLAVLDQHTGRAGL